MASGEKIEYVTKPKEGEPWDVVIIGSGPAALTASIYTTRGAASTLIIAGDKWGGQLMLTTAVDNYPGFPEGIQGPELILRMRKQAERFGADIVEKNAEVVDFEKKPFELAAGGDIYKAKTVIIATGSDTKWLGVSGEDRLRGRGVSSCAPCDAPFFKDKEVVVIGGGDSAMEEALVLTKYSPLVTMVHRRDEFKASAAMQKKVLDAKKQGKIRILWDTEVEEVLGETSVSALKLKTRSESDTARELIESEMKDFNGKEIEKRDGLLIWEMPTQGVFVAIGHIPATDIFSGKIELDKKGYVIKKGPQSDIKEGVFVAGDVHDHTYKQAITAAGYGAMAALETLRYLDKGIPNW